MGSQFRPDATGGGRVVSDLSGMSVYTRDGYRLGDAAGAAVSLERERATALLVTDVNESRFPSLPTGPAGVRVPYDRVVAVEDVVVVSVPGSRLGVEAVDDPTAPASLPDAFGGDGSERSASSPR